MRFTRRRVGAAVLVAVSLTGCTPDKEPAPEVSAVPTTPAAGAELLCGMDRADLTAVIGQPVKNAFGELKLVDGAGAGECKVFTEGGDWLVAVTLDAETSPAGEKARASIAGEAEGVREPDATYTSREGALWGDVLRENATTGYATSYVFVGSTLVTLGIKFGAVGRDRAADQLALSEQITATYDLERGGGS